MSVLAFDIDLCRIHAYSSRSGLVCENSRTIPFESVLIHDTILIEVASPVFYSQKPGEVYNRTKWAVFNSMIAGRIFEFKKSNVLVAPSSSWTCGYPEDKRQAIAGVSGGSHDIRECRTMLFFYGTNPEKWTPFEDYFFGLSSKKTKGKLS